MTSTMVVEARRQPLCRLFVPASRLDDQLAMDAEPCVLAAERSGDTQSPTLMAVSMTVAAILLKLTCMSSLGCWEMVASSLVLDDGPRTVAKSTCQQPSGTSQHANFDCRPPAGVQPEGLQQEKRTRSLASAGLSHDFTS